MLYLGIFDVKFSKNYCHVRNQHPRICLIAKFRKKTTNVYIWDQKCFIWVFLM